MPARGLGMGCSVHVNGRRSFGDWDGSTAIVRVNEDGRATVITGEGEIGQGNLTVLRQIAAEELGLPYEHVDITRPDTDLHSHSLGALASRLTYVAGNAVKNAATAAASAAARGRGRAVQAARLRAHDHQRRDRAAQRRRDRVQAGRRGRAREHLQARRPAHRRRRQFRQPVRVPRPQPLRQRVGRLQLHRAGGRGRGRPRHGRGEAAGDRVRRGLRHRDQSRDRDRPGAGRRDAGRRPRA